MCSRLHHLLPNFAPLSAMDCTTTGATGCTCNGLHPCNRLHHVHGAGNNRSCVKTNTKTKGEDVNARKQDHDRYGLAALPVKIQRNRTCVVVENCGAIQ